jgi:hypothetical protein
MLNALLFRVLPGDRPLEPAPKKSLRHVVQRVVVPALAAASQAAPEAPPMGPPEEKTLQVCAPGRRRGRVIVSVTASASLALQRQGPCHR